MPELFLLLPELPDELRDELDDLLLPLLLLLPEDLEGDEAEDCLEEEDLADDDDLL